jgi:UDP-N-acetylglucosamine 4,6-dehydratase
VRVLITGGTGSLGHALVKAFLQETDWRLVVFSRDELKQAHMRERFSDPRLDFRLGDVRDLARLNLALYGVDAVVHAAALKRVDAVAGDPVEVFKTNVYGTFNVLQAALTNRVTRTLVISSDKACYATNAYGSSKFAAESLAVAFNQYAIPQGCRASVLRYGNVLGSRGSVVHAWRGQDPIKITAPGMTRFIIPMPLAVGLVLAGLEDMCGGEVFVPRIASARLEDLAMAVNPEAQQVFVGLRPGGEKMHETLLTAEEATRSRDIGPYMTLIAPHQHPWTERPEWEEFPMTKDGERRSDTAPKLTVDDLRLLLQGVPDAGV